MLSAPRPKVAWLFAAALAAGLPAGLAVVSCGVTAVGVDACRKIESARCQAATACGSTQSDVDRCTLFYHDQCLYGIENAAHTPTDGEVAACIAAVNGAAACASKGVASMAGCPQVPVVEGVPAAALTPCVAVTQLAQDLLACAWVAAPPVADAGAAPDGDAAADAPGDAPTDAPTGG